jgi:hypothetical protein
MLPQSAKPPRDNANNLKMIQRKDQESQKRKKIISGMVTR